MDAVVVSCPTVDERIAHLANNSAWILSLELCGRQTVGKVDKKRKGRMRTKRCFDNTDLRRSGVDTSKCAPVIDDQASADDIRTTIYCTSLVSERANDQKRDHTQRGEGGEEKPDH